MASTAGIKCEDSGEPDNDEQDGRGTCVHDDEEKHARKKKRVTRDETFLRCGEGPPGDRDGSIYRMAEGWRRDYCIADRDETRCEAMMLSNPKDCMFYGATCRHHDPGRMLQIFSLKLAKIQVAEGCPVELYGYVAARDVLDPLLNYVVNFNRDDPILVEQGSLIEITGPKRGIELCYATLIEYDMRIKTGKQEKDDLQLIDGVSLIDEMTTFARKPFTRRIHGGCGVVDITLSCVNDAVEATIEIVVSEVQSNFSLCVGCFISGLHPEIRLFDGTISESRGLRRSVVAGVMDTWMDLKFKVGSGPSYNSDNDAEHCCTFKATNHGYTSQLVKVKFATVLVKVTWSTLSMLP
ncbi:hypothetical protein HU200_034420 [Digitaria exilis]|uniref:DUF6598 domain-containing protein n=1 Tax=Digitaria exilis TaxID=1010633 RepID=A0A835BJP8_9POAL|nr:hypothetical protein HU200_034420 [Digitaria exilis]